MSGQVLRLSTNLRVIVLSWLAAIFGVTVVVVVHTVFVVTCDDLCTSLTALVDRMRGLLH